MKKKKLPKPRNTAIAALIKRRPKAGPHKDRKKEANRKACRGKVEEEA